MKANSGYSLRVTQQRIENMFKLLSLWQQYVDVIYAAEDEIETMKNEKDNGLHGADLDEASFAHKMENENIEKKLADLFAVQDESDLDDQLEQVSRDNADDPYLSVQEGDTSDTSLTSEGPEGDMMQREARSEHMIEEEQEESASHQQQEEGGIQSSEEEEGQVEDGYQPDSLTGKIAPGAEQVSFNEKQMFKNEKHKDKNQFDFNYGDPDVTKFKANVQAGFDNEIAKKGRTTGNEANENVDYIAKEKDVKASTNIQNINLFGVPLEHDFEFGMDSNTNKEKSGKRQFVKELIDALVSLDPENTLMDLEQPKTFIQFDPYSDGMTALNPFEQ